MPSHLSLSVRRGVAMRARVAVVVLSSARPALAQQAGGDVAAAGASAPTEALLATRREVLSQAAIAARQGRQLLAIELAERAGRILMSPSVRLFLAEQHAAIDDHAAALGAAVACLADAQRDVRASNREQILERCRSIERSARERVVSLVIRAPAPAPPGLVVRVNGQTVSEAFFGLPYFVNAGTFVVDSNAQDRMPYRLEGEAAPGEEVSVTIELVANTGAVAQGEPRLTRRTRRRNATVVTAPGSVPAGAASLMTVGALAGATAVAAGVLYALAPGSCVEPRDEPGTLACPTEADSYRASRMGLWVGVGWSSFALGAASIAAGAAWIALSRSRSASGGAVVVHPALSLTSAGATIGGAL